MKTKILKNTALALLSVSIVTSVVYWTLGWWEGVENAADGDSLTHTVWNSLVDGVVKKTGNVAETITGNKTFSWDTSLGGKVNTAPNTATISGGAITYAGAYMVIDTEAAAAADDLDTINGGSDGDIVVIQIADSNRDITVKHLSGNLDLWTDQDAFINSVRARIALQYSTNDNLWRQISRTIHKDYSNSKGTNGYTFLPNGLIMQRGYYAWGPHGPTITFPIAFPNAALNIQAIPEVTGDDRSTSMNSLTSSSVVITQWHGGTASGVGFYWSAIGY